MGWLGWGGVGSSAPWCGCASPWCLSPAWHPAQLLWRLATPPVPQPAEQVQPQRPVHLCAGRSAGGARGRTGGLPAAECHEEPMAEGVVGMPGRVRSSSSPVLWPARKNACTLDPLQASTLHAGPAGTRGRAPGAHPGGLMGIFMRQYSGLLGARLAGSSLHCPSVQRQVWVLWVNSVQLCLLAAPGTPCRRWLARCPA